MRLARYTYREIVRRRGRTLLTLGGIVLGVAALVAIGTTVEATRTASREMFARVGGRAELEVVAPGGAGLDPSLAEDLARTPGVRHAVPVVQGSTVLVAGDGRWNLLLLGIDPARDASVRDLTIVEGDPLEDADGALLGAEFARGAGVGVGDRATLLTPAGAVTLPVRGLLGPASVGAYDGGAVAVIPLATARRLLGLGDRVTAIQLVLEPDADADRMAERIRDRLPSGPLVRAPAERGAVAQDTLRSLDLGLVASSAMSLVAGVFIILNTFLMNLGERRRQIALLRALGTTRTQTTRLLLREALLLGLVGTALGVGLGLLLARGMGRGVETLLRLDLPAVPLAPAPLVLAALVGPGVSLLATWIPARRAARRSILAGLFPPPRTEIERARRWPAWLGAGMLGVTGVLAVGFFTGGLGPAWIGPGMALMMTGCVLAVPLVLPALSRAVEGLLRRPLGTTGQIAMRQIGRYPVRTHLTVGVLALAVIVGIGMGNSIRANILDLGDWFERTLRQDFFLRGAMPDSATLSTASVPRSLREEIAAVEGVRRVDLIQFVPARCDGQAVVVIAMSFPDEGPVALDLANGDPGEVRRRLRAGEAVVGTVLAHRLGVGPGDEIELAAADGPRRLRVAATVTEYTAGGASLYLDWDTADALFVLRGAHGFMITAEPEARAGLADLARRHRLLLQSNADLRREIDAMMSGVVGFLYVLLGLVFLVASLGIVNTLTMNVLEQTREIGLLRAVGMKARQVRRYVLGQALVLGLLAVGPGLVGGVILALALHRATDPLLGIPVAWRLDPAILVACALLAVATPLLAALGPARRAARIRMFEALTYE